MQQIRPLHLSVLHSVHIAWLTKFSQQGTFEEAEVSFRSQIKVLEEELARQKVCTFSCLPFYEVNGLSRV